MKNSMNAAIAMNEIIAGGPGSGRHVGGGHTSQQFDVRKFKNGADAYKAGHAHVMDQLSRIQALLESQKPSGKEHWGHAGSMSHYSEQLANIHNALAGTGEYAHTSGSLYK